MLPFKNRHDPVSKLVVLSRFQFIYINYIRFGGTPLTTFLLEFRLIYTQRKNYGDCVLIEVKIKLREISSRGPSINAMPRRLIKPIRSTSSLCLLLFLINYLAWLEARRGEQQPRYAQHSVVSERVSR